MWAMHPHAKQNLVNSLTMNTIYLSFTDYNVMFSLYHIFTWNDEVKMLLCC